MEPVVLKGLTGFLVRRFVKNHLAVTDEKVRAGYGYLEGWISVWVNLVLSLLKIALGIWIGSYAVIADGFHSASDMLTSILVIFGLYVAKKPRAQEHPFGHANAELVAGLIMAVLLIVAGFELMLDSSLILWRQEFKTLDANWIVLAALGGTIVAKEWLFVLSKSMGLAINSTALAADAWHHRSDSLTTVAVILGLLGNQAGFAWFDPAVGVLVSLAVIWSGVEIAKKSISPLLGENVNTETVRRIVDLALCHEDVYNAHDIYVHKYGQQHFITLHVEILSSLSPIEMHDISAMVQGRIEEHFGGACTVHVDPVDFQDPRFQRIADLLKGLVQSHQELLEWHDLQFRDLEGGCRLHFEFSVDPKIKEADYPALSAKLYEELKGRTEGAEPHFSLEPGYTLPLRQERSTN